MCCRFFLFLFLLMHALSTQAGVTGRWRHLLITVSIDGKEDPKIYHCYQDEQKNIWVSRDDLKIWGLPKNRNSPLMIQKKEYILLNWYEHLEYKLDDQTLILTIITPQSWHKIQRLSTTLLQNGKIRPMQMGMFLNYDLTARHSQLEKKNYGAGITEGGWFTPYGVGTSSFVFNGYDYLQQLNRLTRLDTTWTLDEPEHMTSWRFGDAISSGFSWNGAVRFAGIQYATNFNTQPGLITFPQPLIRGNAVMPSTVDVLVNGLQTIQRPVAKGPFYLTNLPIITGAGDIQIVTTDLLGRQQFSTFSYYASPIMLKQGLADYSFEIGRIRSDYGIDNYHYQDALGVATYSLGITNYYTAGIHAEVQTDQQTFSMANNYMVGTLGIVNFGFSASHTLGEKSWIDDHYRRGIGGLVNLGFRRQANALSYGVQSTLASHDYMQVGTLYNKSYPNFTLQSFIGLATEHWGSFTLTYTELNNAFNFTKPAPYEYLLPNSDVVLLSYNRNLFKHFFFSISAITDLRQRQPQQIIASLILPLDGGNRSITLNEYKQEGRHQENIQLIKNLPLGNGYGYRFIAGTNQLTPLIAEANAQTNQGLFGARYAGVYGKSISELNARGSLIHFDKHLFTARYVDQAFALVHVPGIRRVSVLSRNQVIGRTNRNGYLYIPELLPYQQNELKLDPQQLPLNAEFESLNKTVIPYSKSGVFVRFDVHLVRSILLTLIQSDGRKVPAGALVKINQGPEQFPVGYNGQVFINKMLPDELEGRAYWENKVCQFKVHLPTTNKIILREQILCF